MLDVLYIGITVAFFAISVAYTRGCDKLLGANEDE